MLTELKGKGGRICQQALDGEHRCPLIVRPSSEDVITGELCQLFRMLNSRWWLPDLLNMALGTDRFSRQYHRRLRITPWENRPRYPQRLLPWKEGSTQVDITMRWENPSTTVYVEAKYGSDLSLSSAGHSTESEYPGDQLIRNIRVGLHECGWFDENRLFEPEKRDFVVILWSPAKGHDLVRKYRDPEKLRASIPHSDSLLGLPALPFVGELSYGDVIDVLRRQQTRLTLPERKAVDAFCEYLTFKLEGLHTLPGRKEKAPNQSHLSLEDDQASCE